MCNYDDSDLTVINCTFHDNSANELGGGIYNRGNNPVLIGCIFSDNSSWGGGRIYNRESKPILTNCIFSGNSAEGVGGGMYTHHGDATVTNCIFSGNLAGWLGGGIHSERLTDIDQLTNCIFWENIAEEGPQIVLSEFCSGITLVNYCDIQGAWLDIYVGDDATLIWGEGNIDDDPCFADADNDDYHLKSQAGRWSSVFAELDPTGDEFIDLTDFAALAQWWLQSGCKGCGGTDLTGDGQIQLDGLNELTDSWLTGIEQHISGDINDDATTNFVDFAVSADRWLDTVCNDCAGDGRVNADGLDELSQNWLEAIE